MIYNSSKTAWFGNGYGVEFIVSDPFTITFNVVTEKDPTLVSHVNRPIGSDECIRNEDTGESLRDFAVRARLMGIAFAEECIEEHKVELELFSILHEILEPDLK